MSWVVVFSRRRASSRMISTAISGNSHTRRKKQVFRDAQDGAVGGRGHGRGPRHIAQDRNLADEIVHGDLGHLEGAVRRRDDDVGGTVDDDEGGIAHLTLDAKILILVEGQPLGRERQELQLRGLDLAKQRNVPQQLDLFVQAHRNPPRAGLTPPPSGHYTPCRPCLDRNGFPARQSCRPSSPGYDRIPWPRRDRATPKLRHGL